MEYIPSYSDSLRADIQPSYKDSLMHHGIKGQKWGVRRYQNKDGSYTSAGKKHRKNTDDFAENTRRVEQGINIAKNVAKYGGLAALAGVGAYGAYKYGSRARNNKNIDLDNMGPTIVDKNGNVVDENDRAVIEATKKKLRSLKRKENRNKAMSRINASNNASINKMVGKHKRQQFARETVDRQMRPQLPGIGGTPKKAVSSSVESFKAKRNGRVSEAPADIHSANKKSAIAKANSKQKKRVDVGLVIGSGVKKIGSALSDKTIGATKRANDRVREKRAQERHDRRRERGRHADTSWEDKVVQNTIKNASATYDSIINGAKQQSMKTGKWAFQEIPGSAKNVAMSKAMDSIGAHLIDYTKELIGETKTAERARKVGSTATTIASKLPKPKRKKSKKSAWDSMLDWANS